jgi:hypothetical protein
VPKTFLDNPRTKLDGVDGQHPGCGGDGGRCCTAAVFRRTSRAVARRSLSSKVSSDELVGLERRRDIAASWRRRSSWFVASSFGGNA